MVVHQAYGATPALARQAVDSAQKAFQAWRNTTPWERKDLLLEAAKYLKDRRGDVADLLKVLPLPPLTATSKEGGEHVLTL